MLRKAASFFLVSVLIPVGLARGQTCGLSGEWIDTFSDVLNLREDAAGNVTGDFYTPGSPAGVSVVSGTRSGTAVNLLLGTNVPLDGTETACDSVSFTVNGTAVTISRVSATYCGDGTIDVGEQCDDGNFANGDGCEVDCTPGVCGNGIVDPGEQCDDGNQVNGDGCSTTCLTNVCGNGIVEPGEQCDDGNLINGDGCSSTCQTNLCGNGIIEPGEQCDDGNTTSGDGCSSLCQFEGCNVTGQWMFDGVFVLNLREDGGGGITGDLYSPGSPSSNQPVVGSRTGTSVTFTVPTFAATETNCDTITLQSIGFTFNRTSTSYCGDGTVDAGEQCDDGNFTDGDACEVDCSLPRCGNEVVDVGEECDDGNQVNGDGCSTTCQTNVCGNGIVESGEQCDDGNITNGDGCSSTCQINVCGNGIIESGEQCDDGNTVNGDGCSSLCQLEGCGVTGRWADQLGLTWNLHEDAGGVINGDAYSDPTATSALSVVGSRTGVSLALTFPGTSFTATGSEATCGTMNLLISAISDTLTRLSTSYCGDGVVDAGEECDDGNFVTADACTDACTLATCGNGVVDPLEQCDDGNKDNNDACENDCQLNVCGDGVLYAGVEGCDDGTENSTAPDAACRPDCTPQRCGDSIVDAGHGEQCDDGNLLPGDGCDGSCLTEQVASSSIPSGGGNVTTDTGGTGATQATPVQAAIASPNAGAASIVVTSLTVSPPAGYQLLGKEIAITAPPATAADPLRFTFDIDASIVPAGENENTLAIFRNGVAVPDCLGSTVASPNDPCVTERTILGNSNIEIVVVTSHASLWTAGKRVGTPVTGAKLILKDNPDPARKGLTLESKDPGITLGNGNGSSDDPTLSGGSLLVTTSAGCNGRCSNFYPLPKGHWSLVGAAGGELGYKYADKTLAAGPIKRGLVKPGNLFKFAGKGAALGHSLNANPAPVNVVLRMGGQTYCATFGGTVAFQAGSKFAARAAPTGTCP